MFRKITSLFLAVVMAVSLNGIPAAMAESSAAPGGTAALFESAAANGLLTGIAGEAKPEDNLTRAQMASILTSAFGAAEQASLSGFTDMDESAWYYAGMAKAVQMGVFLDDGSTLNPEGLVTQEEAFSALFRVFKLPAGDAAALDGLKDKDSISPDALDAAAALLKAGYIAAEDGYLNPKTNMTLAGFLQTLDTMVKCYLNGEGTYTSVPDGGVMINVPDVTLKDIVVKGDLILGDGIGDGSVTLDSVTVTGRTVIRGGGAHSIRITGASSLQSIVIARVNGELRVFAEDGTEIGEVIVDGKDDVIIEGNFASVTLASDNVTVTAVNAKIGSAGITGENSRIIVAAGSDVNTLTVDGANAAVEVAGTVKDIVVNGGGTAVSGDGQVDSVEANANNIMVTTPDTLVTAAAGTSGVTAGTRDVPEGTTVNTTPVYDGGTGGGNKPLVTSVSPARGPVPGGTAVTVKGKYFTDATSVTFGGKAAVSYKVVSSTEITAVAPAGTIGAVIVAVTTPYGTGSKASAFTYAAAPVITSVSPNAGPNAGGAAVTITGTGFTGATLVTFGGTAASYTVASDTSITAVIPAGAAGPADVAITTPGGTKTQAAAYMYAPVPAIASLSPSAGPVSGGTTVTITGSGFTGADLVTFGGRAASYTVVSDTQITAVTPAGLKGPADITVTTAGGTGTKPAAYTYCPAVNVNSASPNAGPQYGGNVVSILGIGLEYATAVTFGGVNALSFSILSDNEIQATVPAGAAGAVVDITVTTPGGTGTASAAYTYIPAPAIASVSPGTGPVSGGNMVYITGTGFDVVTAVTFGGIPASSFAEELGIYIAAIVPAGTAGAKDVAVTTMGGTATASAAYTYVPAPVITSVSPNAGPSAGGNTVTIAGSGFTGATAVTTNGIPVLSFTVVSDTTITAVVRGGPAGPADVAVTANGGTGVKTGGYTYVLPPVITFITPGVLSAAGGSEVTITGSNFSNATGVAFGSSSAASFIIDSDTQIRAITPVGSFGPTEVKVTAIGGTSGPYVILCFLPPAITSVSPGTGPAAGGGIPVTITGSGFMGITSVTFGGMPAVSFGFTSDSQIAAVAPAGTAGPVDVAVTTVVGTATASGAYTYVPAPAITSISPNVGPVTGGTAVTITGSGLTGTTVVTFGGAPASSFTVVSDTAISAVTPAGIPGAANVAVTAAGGTGVKTGGFTFVPPPFISSFFPDSGTVLGGTTVTIMGTNFTTATSVTFGGTEAASYVVNSDTTITAVAPAKAAGHVDVAVTTAGGTGIRVTAYTYIAVPAIASVSPAAGPLAGGTMVTIMGTNFTTATSVTFGGTEAASYVVNSDTTITAVAPAKAAGHVDVAVTTAGGTGTKTNAYTYFAVPVIASFSPGGGPEAGGTMILISGANFTGATSVTFGGVPGTFFTVVDDTFIAATAPAGTAGQANVVVMSPGGASNAVPYAYIPLPTISGISPDTGEDLGSTTVVITGTNLTGATAVSFGAAPATAFTVDSGTQITATAPAGTGTVNVCVTTAGGTSNTMPYTYIPAPAIGSISPMGGVISGGTTVTITGQNFTGVTAVYFGAVPALSYTIDSDTQITAISPAGTGVVSLKVSRGMRESISVAYTYVPVTTIISVSPDKGSTAGGETVSITGTGFMGFTSVSFGGTPAASFTVDSPTQITVTTPAHGAGVVDVEVSTAGGTATAAGAYTYVPAPTITTVSPSAGPVAGGEMVTITGAGFTGATSVTFGGTASALITVVSDNQIMAVTPAHAQGVYDITVTTAGGAGTKTNAYTYVPAPAITSISPNAGPVVGGNTVTITGTGFTGTTSVTIGGASAAFFTVISDTLISAITPVGTAGPVNVVVTSPEGNSNTVSYTYVPLPYISGISPDTGEDFGFTIVVITGTNLTGATAVSFGAKPATAFTVDSGTQITATAPAGTGDVDVSVTTAGGASNTVPYTYKELAIYYVDPGTGPAEGSGGLLDTWSIYGSCFTGATSVTFGGTPAVSFYVDGAGWIVAVPPAGTGTVAVTVTTPNGSVTKADAYTYVTTPTIKPVSPNAGPMAGGNEVTITGTNLTKTTSVSFGGIAATSFTVNSATSVTAIAPAHAAGIVDVAVTTEYGTATPARSYTYE